MSRQFPVIALAFVLGATLGSATASAQPKPSDDEGKRVAQEQARALKGWPSGILFSCVVTPADLDKEPVKEICTRARAEAETLAKQAKVKVAVAADQRGFSATLLHEPALGLTVQVAPSDFSAPLGALVIRIFASRPYVDLVSAAALKAKNPAQNPFAIPRAGDVMFWEELVVGSGPPAQLATGIAPAINAKLQQFFAELK